MVYQTGAQQIAAADGTERVEVDNGAAVKSTMTAGALANAPSAFGGGSSTMKKAGVISVQASPAGVQPGATGADSVLAVFSVPANSFNAAGNSVVISANGSFGATVNNKRVKLIFNPSAAVVGSAVVGGTTIADTGTVTTNGGGWALSAEVVKYGAANSNTQLAVNQQAQAGAAVAALGAPAALTAVENGAILVAVTGNATTAVSDIVFNLMQVFAQNG